MKPYEHNYSIAEITVRKEIKQFLKRALGKNFGKDLKIEYPPQKEMGDFSYTCFSLSESLGKNPAEISQELAEKFLHFQKLYAHLARARNAGPYLNFFVDEKKFSELVLQEIISKKQKYGNKKQKNPERIMIEYSQPNTHKEFHIGHVRNVCIGSFLVEAYRALGYKVVAVNYIGDVGSHVAKCLWAYLRFHKDVTLPKNKAKFLGNIYFEANVKLEEHPEWKKEVSEIQSKLESGDKKLTTLWKKTRQWSLDEFYRIYKKLGVEFDVYFFESEEEKEGKKIVQKLLEKGIAQKSDGAVIIDLEQYGLKKFLILKSDKTSLYATKDLALAQKKFQKYKIDKSFYVIDSRQSFYFKQLFKTLEIMGFRKVSIHIPYEFVTTKEGVLSSRLGNAILFEDFEKAVFEETKKETKKRHPDWNTDELHMVSRKLALTAIKYTMLSYTNSSLIQFDMEKSLGFVGNTGPYLQYVYARISSIFKKAKKKTFHKTTITHTLVAQEKMLLQSLAKFPEVVEEAALMFDPSRLSNYLFGLAQIFSMFYESVPVLTAKPEEKNARLAFLYATRVVFEKGFSLLGIKPLEKM